MKKEKYISLYDAIFNADYTEKDYKEKWEDFNNATSNINNFDLYDFYEKSEPFINDKGFVQDITGVNKISNQFPSLTLTGEKSYLKYKSEQISRVIEEHKKITAENTKNIFPNFELEAIKKVLDYCKDINIISYKGQVCVYADNSIYTIIYDNITIPLVEEDKNGINYNSIINYGTMNGVNQAFNLNISNDDELFSLINDKLEVMKLELNNQHNDKIEELEKAVKKKDKKSILTIISELASVGSLVATVIQMYMGG